MPNNAMQSQTLDETDAATYLGFTRSALRSWRRLGRGPAYIRLGRSIRYTQADLDAWLDAHRVDTSPSPTGAV